MSGPPSAIVSVAVAGSPSLAQLEFVGGPGALVVAVIALLGLTTILSLLVAVRYVRNYRRTRARPVLMLAVGLLLLTAIPTAIQLAFANLGTGPDSYRILVTTAAKLAGLLAILHAIYR